MEQPDLERYDVRGTEQGGVPARHGTVAPDGGGVPAEAGRDDEPDIVSWEELLEREDEMENRPSDDWKYNTLATYNDTQAEYEMAGAVPPYPVRRHRRRRKSAPGLAPAESRDGGVERAE